MCRGALSGVDVTSPNVKKGATVKCERQSRQTRIPAKKQNRFTLGYDVGDSQEREAIHAMPEQPNGFIDTLRNYGTVCGQDVPTFEDDP